MAIVGGKKGFGNDFVNLSDYMNANQGQGQELANQATGKVNKLAGDTKASSTKALGEYTADVTNAGNMDQGLITRALSNPGGLSGADREKFKSYNSGQLPPTMPLEERQNFKNAQNSMQQYNANAGSWNSPGGAGAGLAQMTGTQGFGNQGFNAALFGGAGGGSQVQEAIKGQGSLSEYLGADQGKAKTAADASRQAFNTGYGNLQGQIDSAYAGNKASGAINEGNPDTMNMDQLRASKPKGVSDQQWNQLQDEYRTVASRNYDKDKGTIKGASLSGGRSGTVDRYENQDEWNKKHQGQLDEVMAKFKQARKTGQQSSGTQYSQGSQDYQNNLNQLLGRQQGF